MAFIKLSIWENDEILEVTKEEYIEEIYSI